MTKRINPYSLRHEPDPLAENVCEHGDHAAPVGKRFCSPECARCELADTLEHDAECAGICQGEQP